MKKIVVNGGKKLEGDVVISGSKNAALPIIFACILTNGVSEIENLPDIGDVRVALDMLGSLGASVERRGSVTLIDTRQLRYVRPDPKLVSKIRASTYLLGSCLSRFGRCHIMPFGGCNFSLRPIDMHINACVALGGRKVDDTIIADRLSGGVIDFRQTSVGATVNAILLSAGAEGETLIRGCAVEPHIDSLIEFLRSCGADIVRQGRELRVQGRPLHGGRIRVIGDMIEAGSYLAVGALCGGSIRIVNTPTDDIAEINRCFEKIGARVRISNDSAFIDRITDYKYLSVTASPYPGFPTDLQPILAPLMAAGLGGMITDDVWPTRFGYLESLEPFKIKYDLDKNTARIYPSKIVSGISSATDLRGGMACLISALFAEGESEIYSAEVILRGYENLQEKLCNIGAEIKIIDY